MSSRHAVGTASFEQLVQRTYDSAQRYTTPETLAAERANIQQVRDGRHALAPMMTEREAFAQADTRSFLNDCPASCCS